MFVPFRQSFDRTLRPFATSLTSSRRSQRRAALRRRPAIEDLEGRQMLSTLYVTNTNDSGTGSLRAAILAADVAPAGTYSTIDFNIPGSGLQEIQPQTPLPAIANPVNIDGLSQSGSTPTSPLIRIDGTDAGASAIGLDIESSASGTATQPTQVSGLEITGFQQGGVDVNDASYVSLNDLSVGVARQGSNVVDAPNDG